VEKATGVKVKERVPDYVLELASQIVNVDLPAEDLRERLEAGKIYPRERIERALANFFTPENLTRLRELTLGEIAHALDRRRREDAGEDHRQGAERVMVCLSSRSPNAASLLRKGARLAARLHAPWYAVYIQTPREAVDRIDAAAQRQIANTLQLAHQLGAVNATYKGSDVVATIAAFVEQYGITHILMGRTQQPWFRRWFGRSILERLLQTVHGVDVIVVDNVGEGPKDPA
jgi:two-component system sensor histidine kinase KdpD